MSTDEHAQLQSFDANEVSGSAFAVLPGCHALVVTYEVTYVTTKEAAGVFIPGSIAAGIEGSANTTATTYTSGKPIHFNLLAQPGRTYWVTSTFTGAKFLPRIVLATPDGGDPVTILPDQPCGAPRVTARTPTTLDTTAVLAAVDAAQADLSRCLPPTSGGGGQSGPTPPAAMPVTLTFDPAGHVAEVVVAEPGGEVAACLTGRLRSLRVPAFDGAAVTVRRTVSLTPSAPPQSSPAHAAPFPTSDETPAAAP